MARAGGGASEFITGKDRMQTKVLGAMRRALQPSVTDVSLTWTLPAGLEASVLSKVPASIFQGQMSIIYSQLKGNMVEESVEGRVSLQYKLRGERISNAYSFPLNLKNVHSPTIHRLAGKALISKLEYGLDADSEEVKKRILETSLQSGVISSLTAFVAVMKDTKVKIKGPPVRRDIPTPAFGITGLFPGGVPLGGSLAPVHQLFGSSTSSGPFPFGRALPVPAETPFPGRAPSSGTVLPYGLAPTIGILPVPTSGPIIFGSAPSAGPSLFGSAPPSGSPLFGSVTGPSIFGSAPPSGPSLFGSAPPSGSPLFGSVTGSSLFGSAPSSGNFAFGSAPTLGTPAFGSSLSSGLTGPITLGRASFLDDCPAEEEVSPQMKLILLQKADGSWSPSPELAAVLGISERDFSDQGSDSSVWTTVLAVIWLHSNCLEQKDEWDLLSLKAVNWLKSKAGSSLSCWVKAGTELLKSPADLAVFGL